MNEIFDLCVYILEVCAPMVGMTYNELNVILFVFLQPAITLFVIAIAVVLQAKLNAVRTLNRALNRSLSSKQLNEKLH